ncbi:MAG: biopolymer transporter ExbD [Rickettsiaceae bacterium]|nr:biopolymer transporter ExbD [Rickettsiaceae bacterium]
MSFGGFNKENGTPMSEINTTPLVDVMLVLLIIFIITAPLITSNVNINLPKSNSSASTPTPNVINIGVDEKERIFWNGREIKEQDLPELLKNAALNKPDTELRLQADRNTRYEEITEIMFAAKKAGITKMSFSAKAGN